MPKTVKIVKANGEIQCKDYALKQLDYALGTLANGEYALTISRLVKKRTLDQNRLLWLWLSCIEYETGTPKEDIHDYYCSKFLLRHVTVNGRDEVAISGTSKLNTTQFTDFLEKVQSDAASEFGITLPNPQDLYWAEFEAHYKHFI